ncbi:hypothetical protein [Flavobacterium hercynium]|uniref:Uncharacterized protein n=1 Tax=Flavobacterium hercynium TaxID=387094 RepID=A0A226HI63_9FLAO|nr:hypothetical protein [Flavobacterium hercynium]OXA93794.1 hypothetical protein B0A66_05965 [Flavobacterium hercynium]SMP20365.1 hypothetical protein SAMN06265346_106170 [Flavobacterium hercynium]
MNIKTQSAKAFQDCKMKAVKKIKICFHPNCTEKSINSHILQKNGILSTIAEGRHVMQPFINQFSNPSVSIKAIGLNEAFSFNCFCLEHDTKLFTTIETNEIDFGNYKNCLLFTLRTIYNEKFRKLVNVDVYSCLESNHSNLYNCSMLREMSFEENLGIMDIARTEMLIWNDINNNTESFVFRVREIEKKEICLSSFYNYETSQELNFYHYINGKQKEEVVDIFINLFPYKDKSILMMGYKKSEENLVSKYVESFFSDNEETLESKITNLMFFQCETWAISPSLYKMRIEGNNTILKETLKFSAQNDNERLFFDINIFRDDFNKKFNIFKKEKRLLK